LSFSSGSKFSPSDNITPDSPFSFEMIRHMFQEKGKRFREAGNLAGIRSMRG
jgi:hypothetical protein